MSSKISASDVNNIHIYNGDKNPHELGLCQRHRSELSHMVAEKLDELVASKLFQSQFKEFLPSPDSQENVKVKIHIKDREISVQKLDERGKGTGNSKKIHLDRIGVDRAEIEEAEAVNQSILKQANKIYQDHLSEPKHRKRRAPSLNRRTSHYEHRRGPHRRDASRSHFRNENRPSYYRSERGRRSRSIERHAHRHHYRDHSVSEERHDRPSPSRERYEHHRGRTYHPHSASPTLVHRYPGISFETDLHHKKRRKPPKHTHQNPEPNITPPKIETTTLTNPSNPGPNIPLPRTELSPLPKPLTSNEQPIRNEILSETHLPQLSAITSMDFDRMIHLSRQLSAPDTWGSPHFSDRLREEFIKLPESIRNAIYYETYLLDDPTRYEDPWPIGEKLFLGIKDAQNLCRANAIEHFLLGTLSIDFANVKEEKVPPPELLRRFGQLSERDKQAVYTRLFFIQPKGPDYLGPAHAFAGGDRLSVTNRERGKAIQGVIEGKIQEYHNHLTREQMKGVIKTFQDEYERRLREASAPKY